MKTILTVISTLLMGALTANSNFSPMQEIYHWLANKRRFFYAIGFYAAGFVFVMTGIICGAIESTLQFEAQGFIFWSAMISLALTFVGTGLFLGVVGRLVTPRFLPPPPTFASLGGGQEFSQLIETGLRIFSEMKGEPEPIQHAQPSQPPAPPQQRPTTASPAEERTFEMHH